MRGKIEWIKVSAVVHSTESREKVSEAIANLFPFDFEIKVSSAKGHFGNPIEYLEVEIENSSEIKIFWKNLLELLRNELEILKRTLEERIDVQNILHIRIDKQKAFLKTFKFSNVDPIAIKVKLVVYPAKREKAIEFARELCSTS
ncbi:MAG: RNA-binding domain-containing protein [Archaeoglobaceae archaeon]|nr:exosome subunit [Archaeoglobaceae archaeon]MDW7989143.1 RNA-binding domain-containing protein [Archaeoglobaceae archaeon]